MRHFLCAHASNFTPSAAGRPFAVALTIALTACSSSEQAAAVPDAAPSAESDAGSDAPAAPVCEPDVTIDEAPGTQVLGLVATTDDVYALLHEGERGALV